METLISFFKALSDPNRLRIVGLLAHRPHSVEELAMVLDLKAPTVSHHTKKLVGAGLVQGQVDGHYHVYSLRLDQMQATARQLLNKASIQELAEEGTDAYDRKVLAAFLDDEGRVVSIPMKRKKFDVLLRHALRLFDDAQEWTEREVNRRLKPLTQDVASFRRGFIDHGYMVRDPAGASYRRVVTPGSSPS